MMTLTRFRVTRFRSVDDSGWIEVDDVTALIGTSEAGKSNILLPLWKLNPAKGGKTIPTADYPRKRFTTFRDRCTFAGKDANLHSVLTESLSDEELR